MILLTFDDHDDGTRLLGIINNSSKLTNVTVFVYQTCLRLIDCAKIPLRGDSTVGGGGGLRQHTSLDITSKEISGGRLSPHISFLCPC